MNLGSKVEKARETYRRGGVRELLRVAQAKLGGEPTVPLEQPRPGRPVGDHRTPSGPPTGATSSALDVDLESALRFFEARQSNYVALAQSVAPYLDQDGLLLDVGANIGYFTRTLAQQLGFRGEAHLFEPIPHLSAMIPRVLVGSGVTFHVHGFGLSEAAATIPIHVADDGNLGWNTIVSQRATQGMTELLIEVKPYSAAGIETVPSLIKIDVEGAEYLVLAGMREALERFNPRPVILCEIGWGSRHPQWEAELREFDHLRSLGYQALDLVGAPIDLASVSTTTDVLFVPDR